MSGSLSLTDLALLRALSEEGSLSRAAATLHFSQPTASHHLASLERRVGGRVARRGGRGTTLTELGEVLAAHAERILEQVSVAERDVERHAAQGALAFRIGSFPSAGATLLPRVLRRLAGSDVETSVTEAESPVLQEALRRGDLHAIIAYHDPGEVFTPRDGVEVRTLMADEFVVLLPEHHPLAGAPEVRLAQLLEAPWATGAADTEVTHHLFLHACWTAGFEPSIAYRVTDFVMVQAMVREGLCVAAVPRLGTAAMVDGVVAKSIAGQRITRILFFAFRRMIAKPASELALTELQAVVAEMAGRGIDVMP
jgi:DNA-binding transcriptional LysR family regulator